MTLLEVILKELSEKRTLHADDVLKGNMNMERYNFQCGLIHGLSHAEEIIKARAKDAEDNE